MNKNKNYLINKIFNFSFKNDQTFDNILPYCSFFPNRTL